jgi:multisubunit Na+/H+ antiporter MnhE subunit
MPATITRVGARSLVDVCRRGSLPALACAVLWWVLTGGAPASWAIGLPVALACGVGAAVLVPRADARIDPRGLLLFLPFFVWRSLAGGIDVARRGDGSPRRHRA